MYISGDVDFIETTEVMNETQQKDLEEIVRGILHRVGLILKVDDETFSAWIKSSPILESINDEAGSVFSVSAMLMGDLDLRQETV